MCRVPGSLHPGGGGEGLGHLSDLLGELLDLLLALFEGLGHLVHPVHYLH